MRIDTIFGKRISGIAGIALLCTGSAGAADLYQDVWMTDRYEVEVIVFRHLDQSRNSPEQVAEDEIIRSSPLELYLEPEPTPGYPGPYADPSRPFDRAPAGPRVGFYLLELEPRFPDFVSLPGRRLTSAWERLDRLDAYEPIVHLSWLQAARPADDSVPFKIPDDPAEPVDEFSLEGAITVYKERYVHMEVDLDLAAREPESVTQATETEALPTFGDVFTPDEPEPAPLMATKSPGFKLQESRRIRQDETHYFDHPQFGVIALVSEVKIGEDAEDTE